MKFKKRLLSEEMGLPKSNKKTFTNGKKQKVVVSEEQLQRLLNRINEQGQGFNCEQTSNGCNCVVPAFGMGAYQTKKDCEKAKNCCNGESKPRGTTWDCEDGKCVKVVGKGGVGQYATLQDCEDSNCEERARPTGGGKGKAAKKRKPPKPSPTDPTPQNSTQTSPKKECCKCRGKKPYSIKPGKSCPKSCKKVPCKGTPPTQGNVTTEARRLKTTNPISESEIKDMKKWFNRVNKTGTNYNPSIN